MGVWHLGENQPGLKPSGTTLSLYPEPLTPQRPLILSNIPPQKSNYSEPLTSTCTLTLAGLYSSVWRDPIPDK